MEQIEEQEIKKLSKYNSAALINLRISNIWQDINKFAISGGYFKWNSLLDRIWCELGGDIVKNSGQEKEFKELDKDVSEKLKNIPTKEGFTQFTKEDKANMSGIYKVLLDKEFFLRRLQNKQGKGTAYQEDDDFE